MNVISERYRCGYLARLKRLNTEVRHFGAASAIRQRRSQYTRSSYLQRASRESRRSNAFAQFLSSLGALPTTMSRPEGEER
jgi:hypothetical protein